MATKINSTPESSTVKLTAPQREVIRRLASTEYRLIQHWYTGKCYWVKGICEHWNREPQNANVVNALNDRELLKEFPNRIYLNSGAYTELTVSESGQAVAL